MGSDPSYWPIWAHFLHRWGIDQPAAAILEAAGPLGLLAAQFIYLGQPLFSGAESHAKWSALAKLLESEQDRLSFASFLREEVSP
jgi:hypothetical protein